MFENLDKKKILLITLLVVGLGVLGWLVFIATGPTPQQPVNGNVVGGPGPSFPGTNGNVSFGNGAINLPPPTNANANVSQLPGGPAVSPVAAGGATGAPVLNSNPTLAPVAEAGGAAAFYDSRDGKFYRVSADGTRQTLSDVSYPGAQTVTWSPGQAKAVLEFPDGSNIVYDIKTNKQYTLPKEMTSFSFAPDGSKLAGKFMADNPADRWVVTVNSDSSGLTGIEPMGDNADKVTVEWAPNNQVVALATTGQPQGAFRQEVLLVGFHGENFKSLQIEGRGFQPKWTPDGQKLLYSVYSDQTNYRPMLYLVDAATDRVGNNKQALNLQTWADKCTFASGAAYCAAPTSIPDGAGFVPELAAGVPDNIWRVDLTSGASSLIAQPVDSTGAALTASNLTVSSDGRYLYFTDSQGRLRSVLLKP